MLNMTQQAAAPIENPNYMDMRGAVVNNSAAALAGAGGAQGPVSASLAESDLKELGVYDNPMYNKPIKQPSGDDDVDCYASATLKSPAAKAGTDEYYVGPGPPAKTVGLCDYDVADDRRPNVNLAEPVYDVAAHQ